MKKQTISAVVVTKNEQDKIEKCLQHLTWADELIVVDDNSTDKTQQIAKKYAETIYTHGGDIEHPVTSNKNFGFSKATKDWILSIDADEVVTEECRNEIRAKIRENKYDAFYFNFKQFSFGKEFTGPVHATTKITRLFKKNCNGHYEDMSSHSTIKINGKIGRIINPLYHYPHPDIYTFIDKMNRYTTLDARLIYEGKSCGTLKKKIKKLNFYYIFIEPILSIPYYFLIKKNYKDGVHGLIFTFLFAFYLFVERAKVWQLMQHHKTNRGIKKNKP